MTPCEIGVLLHAHSVREDHPRKDAPAVRAAFACLEVHELIFYNIEKDWWETTQRGNAMVKMICELDFPIKRIAWVDPIKEKVMEYEAL